VQLGTTIVSTPVDQSRAETVWEDYRAATNQLLALGATDILLAVWDTRLRRAALVVGVQVAPGSDEP
jgi:hypothetical protein